MVEPCFMSSILITSTMSLYLEHLEKIKSRKDRAQKRRDKRNRPYRARPKGDSTCELCGGTMTWCTCCEVYSSDCCEQYGTCMCS